jgi:Cu-processing system permease protein
LKQRVDIVWTVASRELGDRLRNRWVWTVSGLLLACSLAISFFGTVSVGVAGASEGLVMASLMNLSVYLVPLLALILGAGAIIDEKRRGTLDLALVYPLSSGEYFIGTFLGYLLALWIALVGSYLPLGLILRFTAGIRPPDFLPLLALALLLGAAFLAVAFLVSLLARDHARAVASAVLVWIVAVFVFDLVLIGLLVVFPSAIPTAAFGAALLLNPTDVFRLLAFSLIGSAASPMGLSTIALPLPVAALLAALVAWVAAPLWLSRRLFQHRVTTDTLI